MQTEVGGMVALPQRVHRGEAKQNNPAKQHVGRAPADVIDEILNRGHNREAADARAADRKPNRHATFAAKPKGNERRMGDKSGEVKPLTDEKAPRETKLPGRVGIGTGDQSQAQADRADGKEPTGAIAVK